MRVAFDAKRAYHNTRGLGNYSRDVIRLLTTYAPEHEYILCAQPTDRYTFPNTRTLAPQGLWRLFPGLWRSRGCLSALKGVDIYHGLSGELPFGIHKTGIRTVVTMHDAIFVRYPELYSPTYRRLFTHKVQYACDIADTIIAISEQTKRDLVEFFHADERKIQVVYQGCSHIFREPVSEEQIAEVRKRYDLPEHYLLDVGAIEARKNLKNLIRALSAAHINTPLIAVGGASRYAEEAAALAKQEGVTLRLMHGVPFRDFPALYKGAEVLCYPSIFEGFGIPILEAMCVGTPVVTSTGSCFAETGGDAALYADPSDIEQIGAQVYKALHDTALRQKMVEKGFQQAQKFTDEVVAANLRRVVLAQ